MKLQNILIMDNNEVKLSDFCKQNMVDEGIIDKYSEEDEKYGRPPNDQDSDFVKDIYSLGLVTCTMMFDKIVTYMEFTQKNFKFHKGYSKELKLLARSMLTTSLHQRPTIDVVLSHPLLLSEVKSQLKSKLYAVKQHL